ncbi:hypothetical protein LR48_Vigan118s001300 [Vigna angularis]|uniref:Uncharacterized protein n=3 Tax=Phaseolus angularis TaxID=3914 RepID=A0A0L9T4R1_PHAAN|nr:hypothetical protein LR48_Vigan118s001300 [Vigna angularis]
MMEGRINTLEGRINIVERWASGQKIVLAEWRRNIQEIKQMILEDQNQERDSKGREKSLDRARRGGKEEFLRDNKKGKKEVKKGRDAVKGSLHNIKKAKKLCEEEDYLANDEEKKEEKHPQSSERWRRTTQEIKEMMQNIKIQIKDSTRSDESSMKGKKDGSEEELEEEKGKGQQKWRKQIKLPTFEGIDPEGWISRVEKVFEIQNVAEDKK